MNPLCPALLAFGMPGPTEWIIIGILGVLIFGRRLPEVGRSLGKGIVEFKKGLQGIEDDVDEATSPQKHLEDQPASASEVKAPERQSEPAPQTPPVS